MRTLLFGAVGALLLVGGFVVGIGAVGVTLTSDCSTTYRLSMRDAGSVADPPEETIAYESLTEYQQSAVDAARGNDSAATFREREPLEALTAAVLEVEGDRYVAELVPVPCRSPADEVAVDGFAPSIVGCFAVCDAYLVRRLR